MNRRHSFLKSVWLCVICGVLAHALFAQDAALMPPAIPQIPWVTNGPAQDNWGNGNLVTTPVTSNGVPYALVYYYGHHFIMTGLADATGHVYAYTVDHFPSPYPKPQPPPKLVYLQESSDLIHWTTTGVFTNDVTKNRFLRWKIDTQP